MLGTPSKTKTIEYFEQIPEFHMVEALAAITLSVRDSLWPMSDRLSLQSIHA
jgi:hypothetical protein